MEEKNNLSENKKTEIGCAVIVALIIGAFFLIPMINSIFETSEAMRQSKIEHELRMNGKETKASEIVLNVIEYIKIKDFKGMEKLLAYDCEYYADGKKYSLESCLEGLVDYKNSKYEERGSAIENEASYRIYLNGNSIEDAEQIITLILKKKVTTEEITYEIKNITLTNNML